MFMSKLTDKVVASRLIEHISRNRLDEIYQSAYKQLHSNETILVRVYNGILVEDLPAAFDTVDHDILLSRLATRFGLGDSELAWFKS